MVWSARDGGFRPTPESLEKARQIAERLGLPFDADAVETEARALHATYFLRICELTGSAPAAPDLTFRHGDYRIINAMAAPVATGSELRFDEQLDHWFMGVTHLVYVAAAFQLEAEAYGRLTDHYTDFLDWRQDPSLLESRREAHWEFFFGHAEAWNVTHPLSRAMTIFVMCHELAHVRLGHLTAPIDNHAAEHEADAEAALLFREVVSHGPAAGIVTVDEKLTCAPVLVMRLLDAERRRHPGPRTDTHPPPRDRMDRLRAILTPGMSDKARVLEDGMLYGFDQLDDKLARRAAEASEKENDP